MNEQINEMTKTELKNRITWVRKEIYKFRKGMAQAYEYEDFQSLLNWKDIVVRYINELRLRGLNKSDESRVDALWNEYFKADKMMVEKLNFF